MDYRDWLLLKVLSEEKNITKAADKLYISQPALTYRIQNLEKEFDSKIISRHHSGILFTPAGEYLVKYSKEMLIRLNSVKDHILTMSGAVSGTLRLGSSSVFSIYILPNLLKEFLDLHPQVELYLKTGLSKQISICLQKEDVSIAIIRGDYPWTGGKILLKEEPICLVSNKPLNISDLPNLPQIAYVTDSSLQPLITKWWHETFSQPSTAAMEVDNMSTCRQMILAGLGWSILPTIGIEDVPELFMQPLLKKDGRPLVRRTWLMYNKKMEDSPIIKAFINFMQSKFE